MAIDNLTDWIGRTETLRDTITEAPVRGRARYRLASTTRRYTGDVPAGA